MVHFSVFCLEFFISYFLSWCCYKSSHSSCCCFCSGHSCNVFSAASFITFLICVNVLHFFVSRIANISIRLETKDFLSSFSLAKFSNSFRTVSIMFSNLSQKFRLFCHPVTVLLLPSILCLYF